jgi:hypothetical protein
MKQIEFLETKKINEFAINQMKLVSSIMADISQLSDKKGYIQLNGLVSKLLEIINNANEQRTTVAIINNINYKKLSQEASEISKYYDELMTATNNFSKRFTNN